MMAVKEIHRFFLLLVAPFVGIVLWSVMPQDSVQLKEWPSLPPLTRPLLDTSEVLKEQLQTAYDNAQAIRNSMEKTYQIYAGITRQMQEIAKSAQRQAQLPHLIYDKRITARLGTPAQHIQSQNIDLKLFYLTEKRYKGYALKVHLKSKDAMKMVLGRDQVGGSETTLSAVRRYGAIAGVNAGGFADDPKTGKRYPLGTTVLNGKYVHGFFPSYADLFFVGLDQNLKLIGGKFYTQEQLDRLQPLFGASFVPILLKDGKKQPIPAKWLRSPYRAPRTVIANYKNDHLLFLVVDGYNENGSSGATLPELQDKLIQLGAQNAYNLDGGGSSSLIVNGRIINRPSDGRLRPLATHFLFFK